MFGQSIHFMLESMDCCASEATNTATFLVYTTSWLRRMCVWATWWWWKIAGWRRRSSREICVRILFGWDKPILFEKRLDFRRRDCQTINFWNACIVSAERFCLSTERLSVCVCVAFSNENLWFFVSCHFYGTNSNSIFIFPFHFR